MAAPWSQRELSTLSQNLSDGFPVELMMTLIPTRGIGAIKQKAQYFGFGVITSKEDGITRFYGNIKSRSRGANVSAEVDEVNSIMVAQPLQAVQNNGIAPFIPYNGLSANALAVRMLTENNLCVDPDIVYTLSLHILQGGSS